MKKEVLYESEMFAWDSLGGLSPFQIIVQRTSENGVEKVEVIRRDYNEKCLIVDDDGERFVPDIIPEETTVTTATWTNKAFEIYKDDPISAVIKKYLDRNDFAHILDWYSPENEYDIEIEAIRKLITKDSSVEEITEIVLQTFKYYFEDDLDKEEVREMASLMKEEIEELKL